MRLVVRRYSKGITSKDVALPVFFLLFLCLLAFRDESLGRDLATYRYIYNSVGKGNFVDAIIASNSQVVFYSYCWLFYNFVSQSFQVFVSVTAIVTVLPIAYAYNKNRLHGYMQIALFVNMSTFPLFFSGIRQGLAISFGVMAYEKLRKKEYWNYLVWTILAMFTHHSGFMVLFLYPAYRIRLNKNSLLVVVPIGLFVIAFNSQIFNILSKLLGSINDNYLTFSEKTGAYGSFLLFVWFTVFFFLVSDETKMDEEAFALRNILVLASFIQSFASQNNLAMRMNYYFIILIPYALAKCLEYSRKRYIRVAYVSEIVFCVFFSILFIYNTYNSYVTGISSLDTIPYIPFWKGH